MQTGYGKRQWLPLETADTSGDPELSATRKILRQLTTKRDFYTITLSMSAGILPWLTSTQRFSERESLS